MSFSCETKKSQNQKNYDEIQIQRTEYERNMKRARLNIFIEFEFK